MILGKYLLVKLNLMLKLKVSNDCMPLSSRLCSEFKSAGSDRFINIEQCRFSVEEMYYRCNLLRLKTTKLKTTTAKLLQHKLCFTLSLEFAFIHIQIVMQKMYFFLNKKFTFFWFKSAANTFLVTLLEFQLLEPRLLN